MDGAEQWAQIEGFPDYAVSDHGRVVSLRYDKELIPRPNSYGSMRVVLYLDKMPHDRYIHHLVAAAFISDYAPGMQIRHKDDDKSNNHVQNLRFPYNYVEGKTVRARRVPVARRVMICETGESFRSVEACAKHIGGDPSSIYRVLRGGRGSHMGYTFEYLQYRR